ncbi:DNA-binding response regulator [Clostridium gasigenes]|uniref:DNA-binding response regulator n=1 Tax=Clostridium gasigenes TaxID=94869 RepID=UPI001C0D016C|nr:DNA-binding response regulator [Clostridium gasigenes]MBU3109345.1 DNA-binding response regulator [Clostridium gasigenes]
MRLNNVKGKIEELYLKGLNANEITKRLNSNICCESEKIKRETIQKHIQRNLLHKKMEHKIKIMERKETIKAVNYEATKYMTDKSFIIKNRSVYRTKLNGDIVINKEVAPCITWDTPRKLLNENKR